MPALVYAPKVTIRIHSTKLNKTIDVTDDIESWNVHRVLGPSVSTADWSLLNSGGKYNGVFSPMDRVVIYLRRLKTVLAFSGYLDSVPLWSALIKNAMFRASCTFKVLQNFHWDPGSPAAVRLFQEVSGQTAIQADDGGLAQRTIDVLSKVVGWDKARIHVGSIPKDWFERLAPLMEEAVSEAEIATMALKVGSSSYLGGSSPLVGQFNQIQGIGPGTGTLPNATGRISAFGGPGGGAYGSMALTGESGTHPADVWYCAMRWPYVTADLKPIKGVDVAKAQAWWRNQRILVTSPKTHKAVVLRAADWGPNQSTRRVIDVSPTALKALGIGTDDIVNIAFADQGTKSAPLGPVDLSQAPQTTLGPSSGLPTPTNSGWGNPGDQANMRTITVQSCTFEVHYLAVPKFTGFVNDLVNVLGYHPDSIGGFNPRKIAGTNEWSNHAYGAAIDIDPDRNPRYPTSAGGPYDLPKPPAIVQLARKWGLGWGGEYTNSKDYMHFEVLGAPASTAAAYPKTVAAGNSTSTGTSSGEPQSSGRTSGAVAKWRVPIDTPYSITAHFGSSGGLWADGHTGTDFAPGAGSGVPIRPVGPGVVHAKGTGDASYGNHITIDHGSGVYTYYAHMESDSPMGVGVDVSSDTTIGYVGETGNTSGPHVHVELRLDADTYDAAKASGGIEKYVPGGAPPPRGVDGSTAVGMTDPGAAYGGDVPGTGAATTDSIGGGLFNVFAWMATQTDTTSLLLTGNRAIMNDEPVMGTVSAYMQAGFRDFCSAPNGDFIGWFPDYFGHYKQAGKMVIAPIEIDLASAPSIEWSDSTLKTHQFAIGSTWASSDDSSSDYRMLNTAGIASVEDARLVEALFNVSREEAEAIATTTSFRYGARPEVKRISQISSGASEFFFACMEFMKNWSSQWHTSMSVTFMPEVYPGMLACFPAYGIQGYVWEVHHSGDFQNGFRTQIMAAPWSTMGEGGPGGMVRGAPL